MYSSARSAATLSFSLSKSSGDGTFADSGMPWPGLVPQVTNGAMSSARSTTSRSKVASSSVARLFQYSTAASQSTPCGACGLSCR